MTRNARAARKVNDHVAPRTRPGSWRAAPTLPWLVAGDGSGEPDPVRARVPGQAKVRLRSGGAGGHGGFHAVEGGRGDEIEHGGVCRLLAGRELQTHRVVVEGEGRDLGAVGPDEVLPAPVVPAAVAREEALVADDPAFDALHPGRAQGVGHLLERSQRLPVAISAAAQGRVASAHEEDVAENPSERVLAAGRLHRRTQPRLGAERVESRGRGHELQGGGGAKGLAPLRE